MGFSFVVDRYSAVFSGDGVVTYRMAGHPEGRTIGLQRDLLNRHTFGIHDISYEGDCVTSNGDWMQRAGLKSRLIE
jgi:hypothetical protein